MNPHKPFVPPPSISGVEVCPDCNGPVRIGDWPICKGDPAKHAPPLMVHRPFPTVVDDNLGRRLPDGKWEPFRPTSQAERKKRMKELKLDYHGRRLGEKGCEF